MYNISYNEMLVLYILREFDFCTQKQIYDSYMLPRQAINYTISFMRANEIFELSLNYNIRGREKAFILEEQTVKAMAKLVLEFNNILSLFLNERV